MVSGDRSGQLLVATPLIGDPNFERTVILLLAENDDGAFGVVLNRPSDTLVGEVAEGWDGQASAPEVVFVGGPVEREAVIGLARPGASVPGHFRELSHGVGTLDLHHPPALDDPSWARLRLFAGSAGWTSGQLDDEIGDGAWWCVPATDDDPFTDDPANLWSQVLRRQGGTTAWFANCAGDPSHN